MREQSDEEHDLPIRPFRFGQAEGSDRWRELPEILLDGWDEAGNVQVSYVKFPDVG